MESVFIPVAGIEFDNNKDYCRACTKYTELSESDGLPRNICPICHDQLLLFNTFRLACVEAESFFRKEIKIKNEKNDDVHTASIQDTLASIPNCIDDGRIKIYVQSRIKKRCKKLNIPRRLRSGKKGTNVPFEPVTIQPNVKEEWKTSFEGDEHKYKIPESGIGTVGDEESFNFDTTNVAIISKNQKRNEKSARKFKCDLCMKVFFQKLHIEAHMRTHQGLKAYKCTECDKSYVNWRSLKVHKRHHHNDGDLPQYKCTIENCDRSYSRKQSLVAHVKAIHLKQKKVINYRNFTCEICGTSFQNNHLLQSHIFIHTGISKFKCEICDKKYPTKYNLKVHMDRHNGIKNYVCLICGLRKVTRRELGVHMNYHTREKQHECKFCQKKFLSYGNMLRHIRIVHFGEKSFKCPHCDRSFGTEDTLKHHVRTHTGEKPHACEICGKRFIQTTALQTHKKTHRNKK